MNILFFSNQISERGTEVALFDYALGNENILKGKSFICAGIEKVYDQTVLKKFQDRFEVCLYTSIQDIISFIKLRKIELIYQITSGRRENVITDIVPSFIHCVFTTKEKFGSFYCPISDYLNRYYHTKYPVLPHMVKKFPGEVKSTLRKELCIPESAVVFGGYGGPNSFNIPFVKNTIIDIAKNNENIYFVFLNFTPFTDGGLKNIVFLPGNTDNSYKASFITMCAAMIHARLDGETFGLSIAEFSVWNRPVITWKPNILKNYLFVVKSILWFLVGKGHLYATAHLSFLGKKAICYASPGDLCDIIINFKKKYLKNINYDCYSERFSEEKVMNIFSNIITGPKIDAG
jgi:hypothetical protein